LTESILVSDVNLVDSKMSQLASHGVNFSMDDFGTGYSSLTYVKRLPIDQLKIDQSFVRDLTSDRDDEAITRAIIAMAHSMNMEVVAEGVETEVQARYLAANGCATMQGYLFYRPIALTSFMEVLAAQQQAEAPALAVVPRLAIQA